MGGEVGRGGAGRCAGALLLALVFLPVLGRALEAATPAGTVITNSALAIWEDGEAVSNTAELVVAQVGGVEVDPGLASATGAAGTTVYYAVRIRNTGNGTDIFDLSAASALGWPVGVVRDDNGDGIHQVTETTAATDTGSVASGAEAAVFLAVTIPAGASETDSASLTASSRFDASCTAQAVCVTEAFAILPDFSAAPREGEAPLEVTFTDLSAPAEDVTGWMWDFGDGATSTERNPRHLYQAPGTYTVSLTIATPAGSLLVTRADYITVTAVQPPTADFSAAPREGEAPLEVAFTDLSTPAEQITGWAWDFGDGATSTQRNPTHVYEAPGTYTVSLTVQSAAGPVTTTRPGYITVTASQPPTPEFSGAPQAGLSPLEVCFQDETPDGEKALARLWSFGDGATSDERDPRHVYTKPKRYTVSLSVTTPAGSGTTTKRKYITVRFTDVSADHWAFEEIMNCADADIVGGYPDASYRPSAVVSRDQLAVFMSRAVAGSEEAIPEAAGTTSFPDVPVEHWAHKYVEYARSRGIVEGYPDGRYRPDVVVDRGQMAVFVCRSLAAADSAVRLDGFTPPEAPTFPDVTKTNAWSWCWEYVEFAAARGIVAGYEDGKYHPERVCTRDQIAVYISRSFVGGD